MSVFELLREALTPEQVLGVARNSKLKCVAPEHEDNPPSMHVYDDHVHCFSCGFHGDVVNIWSAQHGFDRQIEAAAELAQAFRIELPEMSPEAQHNLQERREKEESYFTQAELCHSLLEKRLHIREWWESRGFSREHQERFLLGASEDGRAATIPFWHRGRVQGLIYRNLKGKPRYVYPKVQDSPRGYRPHVKREVLPLVVRLEDDGRRDAALRDVDGKLKIGIKALRKALAAIEHPEVVEENSREEKPKEPEPSIEKIKELTGRPGVLGRYVGDTARIHSVVGERAHLKLITLVQQVS